MIYRGREAGQALITSAFLFAIAIAIITVMLNNVIYSNNIAYLGFMDQSQNDDSSLGRMTANEINYMYTASKGDATAIRSNVTDYTDAVNTLTLSKGKFISVDVQNVVPLTGSSQSHATKSRLYIYGRDINKSYIVDMNYTSPAAPKAYTPGDVSRNPGNVIVRIGTNRTELPTTGIALLVVDVVNSSTYMPEPNVTVILKGVGYFNGIGCPPDPYYRANTNENGQIFVNYTYGSPSLQIINATVCVGTYPSYTYRNKSNNVTIVVYDETLSCGHTITFGSPDVYYNRSANGNQDYINIFVPVTVPNPADYSNFKVDVSENGHTATNLQYSAPTIPINQPSLVATTTPYNGYVWIQFKWKDMYTDNTKTTIKPYSVVIDVSATATCNTDNAPFSQDTSYTISGSTKPPGT